MKRILPLIVGLSLVSCDSPTKEADGTSSETQTALQALADNVIEVPRGPSGLGPSSIAQTAGRVNYVRDACESGLAWSDEGWAQVEYFDSPTDLWNVDSFVWYSARSELARDNQGNRILKSCPIGPMSSRAVERWRARTGEYVSYEGRFWRDRDSGGMTFGRWEGAIAYPSGFELRTSNFRSGPNIGFQQDTLQEWIYSFAEERYSFRFFQSLGGGSMPSWESLRDSIHCAPILDRADAFRQVGSVCGAPGKSRWIVRDAKGNVINPQRNPAVGIDDSMGVRVLSTRWDGDSLRVRFQVKTPPFSLRQTSRTWVVVGDTAENYFDCVTPEGVMAKCPQPIPLSDKEFAFADTNFVGPEDGELAFFAQDLAGRWSLRIELRREYLLRPPSEFGWPNGYDQHRVCGTWRLQVPSREE